jgi:hypothetical protein
MDFFRWQMAHLSRASISECSYSEGGLLSSWGFPRGQPLVLLREALQQGSISRRIGIGETTSIWSMDWLQAKLQQLFFYTS